MTGSVQPGEPFNPYRMFTGLFIPEGLARSNLISAGAKLAYGRLARYAGQDGHCYPSMRALASEIGIGDRQAQKYIRELERARLIRRIQRFSGSAQTSNSFEFLWHVLFGGMNDRSGEGVNDNSLPPVNDSSPKESPTEESHSQEVKTDLDYLLHFGNEIDPPAGTSEPSKCKLYPYVRECLARYMQSPGDAKDYPSERMVVDIMDAAGTDDEQEVVAALKYFYDERGLKPFTENGPKSFAWFKTVLQDYFTKKRRREAAANPTGYHEWEDRNKTRLSKRPLGPKLSGSRGKGEGATTYG